jgi:hypothetical protein
LPAGANLNGITLPFAISSPFVRQTVIDTDRYDQLSDCWHCLAAEAAASVADSASSYDVQEYVRVLSIVEAVLKFRQILRQIFLADVVIAAHDSALNQRPERFDVVCADPTANILAITVFDDFAPYPLCSSVATKSTLSDVTLRTKPVSVSVSVVSIIWQTTLPLRAVAPMTGILPDACPPALYCVFLS